MSDHFVSEAVYLTTPTVWESRCTRIRPAIAWRYDERQLYIHESPRRREFALKQQTGALDWNATKTVLGHVHLYVDDIDKAEAFYHTASGSTKWCGAIPARCSCRGWVSSSSWNEHLGRARRRRGRRMRGC